MSRLTMEVPADLAHQIRDEASAMVVPPDVVLRACIELAMRRDDDAMLELVLAVEMVLARSNVTVRL